VEAFDDGADAFPGLFRDRLLAVQNAGNRRDRDGRGAGNVTDGYRQRTEDRWKSACVIVYIEPDALSNPGRRSVSSGGSPQPLCRGRRETNGEAPSERDRRRRNGAGCQGRSFEAGQARCTIRARPTGPGFEKVRKFGRVEGVRARPAGSTHPRTAPGHLRRGLATPLAARLNSHDPLAELTGHSAVELDLGRVGPTTVATVPVSNDGLHGRSLSRRRPATDAYR
jgi:hypothetical protein